MSGVRHDVKVEDLLKILEMAAQPVTIFVHVQVTQ